MKTPDIINLIDALDDNELSALQIAVLLGDTFWLDHIVSIANIKPSKLLYLLDRLIKANIIKKNINATDGTYFFCNKTFPEIILKSIDGEKRKTYYSRLIKYMEDEDSSDNEKALILAGLYLQFRDTDERFQHIKKAADLLMSAHQTEEALALYKEIIDTLAKKAKNPLENVVFIESVISYAPISINIKSPDMKILHIVNQAILLADELGNRRARVMLELCLGSIYQRQGKYLEASPHFTAGWTLAHETKDVSLIKNAAKLYALSLFWRGQIKEAIQVYENTLGNLEEISPDLKDLWPYLMLAWSYAIAGRIGRGLGLVEAIRKMALSKGHLKTQAFAHGVIALIFMEARMCDQAEPHIKAAIDIGEKIGSEMAIYMANPCKAYIEMTRGNLKEAKELSEYARVLQDRLQPIVYITSFTFEVYLAIHKQWETVAGDSLPLFIRKIENHDNIYTKGIILRYKAISIMLNKGSHSDAIRFLNESRDLLEQAGANIELGRTQIEIARLYIREKDNQKAKEYASLAYTTLSEINTALFPPELSFLIEEKTKDARWNHGVSELESAIELIPDFDKYLGKVVEILTDMFGAERTAILLKEKEGKAEDIHIAALRNFSSADTEIFGTIAMLSLISNTMSNLKPMISTSQEKTRSLLNVDAEKSNIKSLALIPLISAKKTIGFIYMDSRLLEDVFTMQDMTILTAIATQIAIACKASLLYKEANIYENDNREENADVLREEFARGDFPHIIGKSKGINDVIFNVKKVAKTNATVLIDGETGVGKELIASAIHQFSNRNNGPFIVVNLSALNENLTTSELFGYEKGAYTGALKTSPGRFEVANGGTIFLDEIGELSLDIQVKLLRILQDHKFERVGSNKTISSDFRLILATNKNLSKKVTAGEFRSDLFFRINSFTINIPPLRERTEDISPLAHYFMAKHSRANNKHIKGIPASEMKKLMKYSWPGNIRELDNVIEKAVILSEGAALTIPSLENSAPVVLNNTQEFGLLPLHEIERTHIINILNHTRWRIRGDRGAAKILGLKPTTLEFRIKKLGIEFSR